MKVQNICVNGLKKEEVPVIMLSLQAMHPNHLTSLHIYNNDKLNCSYPDAKRLPITRMLVVVSH